MAVSSRVISMALLFSFFVAPSHSFIDGPESASASLKPVPSIDGPKNHRPNPPSAILRRKRSLILTPSPEKHKLGHDTAVVLFPGCMLKPIQYEAMARSIQDQSNGAIWIHVPHQVHGFTNPFSLGDSVRRALGDLQELGFPGTSTFVGGHSLGAAFLPSVFDVMDVGQVDGFIRLGCVASRGSSEHVASVPQLTLCGDLDGLVRTSRVAEEYYHYVLSAGNTEEAKLHHAVVLIEGMNHFGFVEGQPTFMHAIRDLEAEITTEESVMRTASAVAEFLDYNREGSEVAAGRLVAKVDCTTEYIQPLIEAMHLEGSFHLETPCHLDTESSESCTVGSPWVERVQRGFSHDDGESNSISDEFHRSYGPWFPKLAVVENHKLELETTSEAVYEKPDFFFDAGFFSNTALEIRSKLTSPQSILKAQGVDAECDVNEGVCSSSNENTIRWALIRAPDRVRERYESRGVQLTTGRELKRSAGKCAQTVDASQWSNRTLIGPFWIWSYMEFRRTDAKTGA